MDGPAGFVWEDSYGVDMGSLGNFFPMASSLKWPAAVDAQMSRVAALGRTLAEPRVAATVLNCVCFFVCGMCLTYPWNSVNAAVTVFTDVLGRDVYIYMQAAYYLPLLPCLLLQTRCDSRYDRRFGLRRAYSCRFAGTGAGLALAAGLFAVLRTLTLPATVLICTAVGVAQSLAFGAACQCAVPAARHPPLLVPPSTHSRVGRAPPSDRAGRNRCAARFEPRCVLVFSCGYQASPILVLALTVMTGGAPEAVDGGGGGLYWLAGALAPLVGAATLLLYLACSPDATAVLAVADARMGEPPAPWSEAAGGATD